MNPKLTIGSTTVEIPTGTQLCVNHLFDDMVFVSLEGKWYQLPKDMAIFKATMANDLKLLESSIH